MVPIFPAIEPFFLGPVRMNRGDQARPNPDPCKARLLAPRWPQSFRLFDSLRMTSTKAASILARSGNPGGIRTLDLRLERATC